MTESELSVSRSRDCSAHGKSANSYSKQCQQMNLRLSESQSRNCIMAATGRRLGHREQLPMAAGFDDGRLRIFDTAAAALAAEMRQHRGSLQAAGYSADGSRLYTAGSDGIIGVLDVTQVPGTALGCSATSAGSSVLCECLV